jgi:uncharacterized protein YrrD
MESHADTCLPLQKIASSLEDLLMIHPRSALDELVDTSMKVKSTRAKLVRNLDGEVVGDPQVAGTSR